LGEQCIFNAKTSSQFKTLFVVVLGIYVVASKCPGITSVSEKYETVQSFKLHFLQINPLLQLCTFVSDRKGVGNFPGSHFVKAFSALSSHS